MRKALCSVFAFLLSLVKQLVDLVADTLIYIGTAAVEVLSKLASAVSSSFLKSPLGWVVLGVGAYFLLGMLPSGEEKKHESAA